MNLDTTPEKLAEEIGENIYERGDVLSHTWSRVLTHEQRDAIRAVWAAIIRKHIKMKEPKFNEGEKVMWTGHDGYYKCTEPQEVTVVEYDGKPMPYRVKDSEGYAWWVAEDQLSKPDRLVDAMNMNDYYPVPRCRDGIHYFTFNATCADSQPPEDWPCECGAVKHHRADNSCIVWNAPLGQISRREMVTICGNEIST